MTIRALVIALLLAVLSGLGLGYAAARLTQPQPLRERSYLVYPTGPRGPKLPLKGNEIRTQGFCVEIWLNRRVDTIVCPSALIVTEGEATTGAPDMMPAETP